MFISLETIVGGLKIVTGVAIFFVWVVRYDNIKKEFVEYGFPTWVRDVVGILKISFVALLQFPDVEFTRMGSLGITVLMLGAVFTHVKMKSDFRKYIPSVAMLAISLIILVSVL